MGASICSNIKYNISDDNITINNPDEKTLKALFNRWGNGGTFILLYYQFTNKLL